MLKVKVKSAFRELGSISINMGDAYNRKDNYGNGHGGGHNIPGPGPVKMKKKKKK